MTIVAAQPPEVVLDLSRLLSRVLHPTPTGVDRVEMAYATDLLRRIPDRLSFAAVHPSGLYGRLPTRAVERFLDATEARWRHGGRIDPGSLRASAAASLAMLRPRRSPRARGRRVYLQSSPHHLERPERVAAILHREQAAFVCLVHDLIPIVHPEYARPDGAAQHLRRVRTIAEHARGIVSNSAATQQALLPYLADAGHAPMLRIAHLGADPAVEPAAPPPIAGTYFVCVATIEPRKNHLLLLNIWRRFAEERRADIPKLVLIGRRGWENEQIVDMLDRCPSLQEHVLEFGGMPDGQMRSVVANARALLLPSFAEGFGMPVTEALAAGVPVIASDIDALREAGGAVPDYLDPLDGIAWIKAILDHASPESPLRAAQLARMHEWRLPTWDDHMAIVSDLVDRVGAAA